MMVNAPYRVNFGLWQVFMYKEAWSFVDSGNALCIGLLFLIVKLKQVNASRQMQAMIHVLLGRYKFGIRVRLSFYGGK